MQAVRKALSLSFEKRYLFTLAESYASLGDRDRATQFYKAFVAASRPKDPYTVKAKERLERLN